MSRQSQAVKDWRKRTKQRMIDSLGGKCMICGYDKCNSSLTFHHLDPTLKEISISRTCENPKSWKKIVDELRKCICLCRNCHGEVHANITKLPEKIIQFDEKYAEYVDHQQEELYDECPVCGNKKKKMNTTCSKDCAASRQCKIAWDTIDIRDLIINKKMNYNQIGDLLGVSSGSVIKRLKKLKCYVRQKKEYIRENIIRVRPTKEDLEKMILEKPLLQIGRQYGVSDNAVRKWCKNYNINLPDRRGYWAKVQYGVLA